jgi:Cft2 family RNA processing exonuclease
MGKTGCHTKGIAATKQTIELLKLLGSDAFKLALVAHHLNLMTILHDIEKDQFAPGQSIGTNPT